VAVAATELHPLTLASSDALKVGQGVVALGSPFGRSGTMTTGIVSGLGRMMDSQVTSGKSAYSIPDAVQTDAAINPGNSGRPLLDLGGNVVGVIAQIASNSQSSAGVGFAVPSDIVAIVTRALIDHGEYHPTYLGMAGRPLDSDLATADKLAPITRGLLVEEAVAGSPTEKAGLRGGTQKTLVNGEEIMVGGDVVVSVDGHAVREFGDVLSYLWRHGTVGKRVTLGLLRDGEPASVTVTLAATASQALVAIPLRRGYRSALLR